MSQYNVKNKVFTTICQKCNAKPTKVPLTDFLLPNGLLWMPEILYCPECGNYVTIQTRDMTKEELKERDEKLSKDARKEEIEATDAALDAVEIHDEFAKVDPKAVERSEYRVSVTEAIQEDVTDDVETPQKS